MRITFLLVTAAVVFAPVTAFADCAADLASIHLNAKPEENDKLNSPRAQALLDKAAKLVGQKNEKDCLDTLKGLHQLMGRSE